MYIKFTAWAIASAFICAPLAAHADLSASASITGLQFVLSDLTPNDSVAPSLTMPAELQATGWNSTASVSIRNFDGQQAADWQHGIGSIGDASAGAVFSQSHAQASLTGSGSSIGPYNFIAAGTLVDTPSGDYFTTDFSNLHAQAGTNETMGTSFLLSAHTSLTLNGQADLFVSMTSPYPNVFTNNTIVSSKFLVRFMTSGPEDGTHFDFATKELMIGYPAGPLTDSFDQSFSFNYANNTDHDVIVSLWANAGVGAIQPHLPASPVPEPGSQILMVLGMLGLLSLTRRR